MRHPLPFIIKNLSVVLKIQIENVCYNQMTISFVRLNRILSNKILCVFIKKKKSFVCLLLYRNKMFICILWLCILFITFVQYKIKKRNFTKLLLVFYISFFIKVSKHQQICISLQTYTFVNLFYLLESIDKMQKIKIQTISTNLLKVK